MAAKRKLKVSARKTSKSIAASKPAVHKAKRNLKLVTGKASDKSKKLGKATDANASEVDKPKRATKKKKVVVSRSGCWKPSSVASGSAATKGKVALRSFSRSRWGDGVDVQRTSNTVRLTAVRKTSLLQTILKQNAWSMTRESRLASQSTVIPHCSSALTTTMKSSISADKRRA